jgi:hypothetical protein
VADDAVAGRSRSDGAGSSAVGVGVGDALAGGAHGEGGGRGHVHVVVRGDELQSPELLHLLLQPPVLLGQRLAAALKELAVHFRLLQLRPGNDGRNRSDRWSTTDLDRLREPNVTVNKLGDINI